MSSSISHDRVSKNTTIICRYQFIFLKYGREENEALGKGNYKLLFYFSIFKTIIISLIYLDMNIFRVLNFSPI